MSLEFENEDQRREYYKKRIRQMKREKARALRKRQLFIARFKKVCFAIAVFLIAGMAVSVCFHRKGNTQAAVLQSEKGTDNTDRDFEEGAEISPAEANPVPHLMDEIFENQERQLMRAEKKAYCYDNSQAVTIAQTDDMQSNHALLVHLDTNTAVAEKGAYDRISPASMTKILTLLVAVENLTEAQLTDAVTITIDDTDYSYSNDCSAVGFAKDEVVTVKDLLYGTILSSGGDAASALGKYIAGSREAFVELMNGKLKELGLAETTHFTNGVGLYDEAHYSTVHDIAVILNAAIDNPVCREVLSAHKYTTSASDAHPEGITISNWFLRRIEDKDTHGKVICAKTGYVVQSGNCAASYQQDKNGQSYICVTADAHSSWRCIYDHVTIYEKYTGLQE